MTDYVISNLENDTNDTINKIVKDMCKNNNINYEKQEYKILFCNEKMYLKNNETKFTSGSKKDLSFYGKVYSNKKGKVVENIFLDSGVVQVEPKENDLLVISGGVKNSTVVEIDQELLYFYIAPNSLLEAQKPNLWQSL